MRRRTSSSRGFHIIELVIVIAVVGLIGFIAFRFLGKPSDTSKLSDWQYDQEKMIWQYTNGTAPGCKEPFKLDMSPVDMSKVVAIGMPGQYRGMDYKAHGGLRVADATNGNVEVKMPMDAKLISVNRYYERTPGNDYELQYILDFESDCGIAFRFDHIYTLTPEFQAYADKSPEPKKDDTRQNPDEQQVIKKLFKAGEIIATRVGFPSAKNYGFDFGVYDYRQRNAISSNQQWMALHQQYAAQHFYGVCWIDMLPAADATRAEALIKDPMNYDTNKPFVLVSDYCDIAPHKTLEFNDGKATEG